MSFLFHKKTKKVVGVVWAIIAIFVALGMVLFLAPGLYNALLQ